MKRQTVISTNIIMLEFKVNAKMKICSKHKKMRLLEVCNHLDLKQRYRDRPTLQHVY